MTNEQISPRSQLSVEFLHQGLLGRLIEVDNNISTKNDIHFIGQTKIIIHEVDPLKAHQRPELGGNTHQ